MEVESSTQEGGSDDVGTEQLLVLVQEPGLSFGSNMKLGEGHRPKLCFMYRY